MGETTLQTARKCPKCNSEGALVSTQPTEDLKLTGYVYQCENKVCPWFSTRWVVTADEDDKVTTRDPGHDPKRFPAMEVPGLSTGRRVIDSLPDDTA